MIWRGFLIWVILGSFILGSSWGHFEVTDEENDLERIWEVKQMIWRGFLIWGRTQLSNFKTLSPEIRQLNPGVILG